MPTDDKEALWEELKILQSIIDKFDGFSFQIKNWFLLSFSAITGYAVVNKDLILLILNFGIIFIFYSYEVTYRISQEKFLDRLRDVQKWLRNKEKGDEDIKTPDLDGYLFLGFEKVSDKSLMHKVQKKIGIEEKTSKKNVQQCCAILIGIKCYIFQFRISFPYIVSFFINIASLVIVVLRINKLFL